MFAPSAAVRADRDVCSACGAGNRNKRVLAGQDIDHDCRAGERYVVDVLCFGEPHEITDDGRLGESGHGGYR